MATVSPAPPAPSALHIAPSLPPLKNRRRSSLQDVLIDQFKTFDRLPVEYKTPFVSILDRYFPQSFASFIQTDGCKKTRARWGRIVSYPLIPLILIKPLRDNFPIIHVICGPGCMLSNIFIIISFLEDVDVNVASHLHKMFQFWFIAGELRMS